MLFVQLDACAEMTHPSETRDSRHNLARWSFNQRTISNSSLASRNCRYPFAMRENMPQTNNGEHNENQYSHERALNAVIDRQITSFTAAVNRARKFAGKDTSGKERRGIDRDDKSSLTCYCETASIPHFAKPLILSLKILYIKSNIYIK